MPDGPLDPDDLAGFVTALQDVDTAGGPEPPGGLAHSGACIASFQSSRAPEWARPPVWIHCDLDARNVLVRDGRFAAVLDWGGAGVGDPAVDVMAAWKLVAREERDRFRELVGVDDPTWLRARGWCVSQALIALGYYTPETNPPLHAEATRWLVEVLTS
jgi:aminoglycoside phosphotransferase (APT) family kinase protein